MDDRGFVFADSTGVLDLDGVSKSFSAILRDLGIKAKGLSLHSPSAFRGDDGLGHRERRTDDFWPARPCRSQL
jgi:hypothetical protein